MEGQLPRLDAWHRALFPSDSHAPSFLAEFQFYFQLQSVVIEKARCLASRAPHSPLRFPAPSDPHPPRWKRLAAAQSTAGLRLHDHHRGGPRLPSAFRVQHKATSSEALAPLASSSPVMQELLVSTFYTWEN